MSGQRTGAKRQGAAAVELALILPVLALLALACLDFGRFAYHHVAVINAARAGAEYAITNPFGTVGEAAWRSQVESTARSELTNQTGSNPERLTAATAVTAGPNGSRQVRIETTYTGFQTLVSWPGIPDRPVMRSAIVLPAIR